MQIHCPSCGRLHETADHPNAFDIACPCGYSLLIPLETSELDPSNSPSSSPEPASMVEALVPDLENVDSQSLNEESPLNSTPLAQIASDEAFTLQPDDSPPTFDSEDSNPLTPPTNLPEGMLYDPYELKSDSPGAGVGSDLQDIATNKEVAFDESSPSSYTAHDIDDEETERPAISQSAPSETAQGILDRTQLATMGQFLGVNIDLQIEGLDKGQRLEVFRTCQAIVRDRPWLEVELQRRDLKLEDLVDNSKVKAVPEFLAVQIYLSTFELGGRCKFSPSV